MSDFTKISQLFNLIASDYESQIVQPAFLHFARAVMATCQPQMPEIALDIGTGTGVLARELAPQVRQIVGIDLAEKMVRAGADLWPHGLLAADAHRLPFPKNTFDVVVSSFGLNATTPRRLFPEILRVLKPEGRLVFHEWNLLHSLDGIIVDTLAEFMLADEDAPDDLFDLREFMHQERPWDHAFQTADDFQEELSDYGFADIQVWEDAPVHLQLSIPDFLTYKLAWANRQAELAAMDEWTRADCMDALQSTLQDEADSNGLLHYAPVLFRVSARQLI